MAQATDTEARRLAYRLTQTHIKQTNKKKSKLTEQQINKLKHIQKRQQSLSDFDTVCTVRYV